MKSVDGDGINNKVLMLIVFSCSLILSFIFPIIKTKNFILNTKIIILASVLIPFFVGSLLLWLLINKFKFEKLNYKKCLLVSGSFWFFSYPFGFFLLFRPFAIPLSSFLISLIVIKILFKESWTKLIGVWLVWVIPNFLFGFIYILLYSGFD